MMRFDHHSNGFGYVGSHLKTYHFDMCCHLGCVGTFRYMNSFYNGRFFFYNEGFFLSVFGIVASKSRTFRPKIIAFVIEFSYLLFHTCFSRGLKDFSESAPILLATVVFGNSLSLRYEHN